MVGQELLQCRLRVYASRRHEQPATGDHGRAHSRRADNCLRERSRAVTCPNKENDVRKMMTTTVALALTSLVLPASPASAHTSPTPAPAHPRLSAHALAVHRRALQRVRLERHVEHALVGVAARLAINVRELVERWQRVAVCEVAGNWAMQGPYYSGIGFSNSTWVQFGGRHFAPNAGRATRMEQIYVGMEITRTYVPDQNGCDPYGW